MDFVLNERLAASGMEIARMHHCRILLKNETNFPWFIVVPEVPEGVEDLHQLDEETFNEVMTAVRKVSRFVMKQFQCEKMNVACIGNLVRQMHLHVVGRSPGDRAWPGVVWQFEGKQKYVEDEAAEIGELARAFLEC